MSNNIFSNDQEFVSSFKKQLFIDSTEWFGQAPGAIHFIDRMDRRYSFIFRAVVHFRNKNDVYLVIKIPRNPSMTKLIEVVSSEKLRQEAKLEAKILERIYQRVQESSENSLAAIKVYGYYPQFCAIVMEELRMRLLKEDITGFSKLVLSNKNWKNFISNATKSSAWLFLFHEASDMQQDIKLSETNILEDVNYSISRLENVSGLDFTNLRIRFEKYYESIKSKKVKIGMLHNDFHLGNVFILKGEKVGAFDPNWESRGPIYIDIARLMIDLETRRSQILSFGILFSQLRIDEYKSAVLSGYFRISDFDLQLTTFFCALEVVKKWRVNEEFFVDKNLKLLVGIKPILMFWTRRYFNNLIHHYI